MININQKEWKNNKIKNMKSLKESILNSIKTVQITEQKDITIELNNAIKTNNKTYIKNYIINIINKHGKKDYSGDFVLNLRDLNVRYWNCQLESFIYNKSKNELLVDVYWQGDSTDGNEILYFDEVFNRDYNFKVHTGEIMTLYKDEFINVLKELDKKYITSSESSILISLVPETKDELIKMIKSEIKEKGNNCDLNHIKTHKITDMSYLFSDEYELNYFNGDISKWDVSKVETMENMFFCSLFDGNINNWDVSKVETMERMFANSYFNQQLNDWKVSKVETMERMFAASRFNQPINDWDVSKVENMREMFYNSTFNQNISKWKISKECETIDMFEHCKIKEEYKPKSSITPGKADMSIPKTKDELQLMIKKEINKNGWNCDLNHIKPHKITDMSNLFGFGSGLKKFNGDISNWDVSKVENMSGMFSDSKFNGDISKWNVSKVKDMNRMFFNSEFNGDISKWNVSNVENMESMFLWSVFNQPLDKWNVSNVENMKEMFNRSKFNQNISKWKINKKCITTDMFEYCKIKEEYKPNLVK